MHFSKHKSPQRFNGVLRINNIKHDSNIILGQCHKTNKVCDFRVRWVFWICMFNDIGGHNRIGFKHLLNKMLRKNLFDLKLFVMRLHKLENLETVFGGHKSNISFNINIFGKCFLNIIQICMVILRHTNWFTDAFVTPEHPILSRKRFGFCSESGKFFN